MRQGSYKFGVRIDKSSFLIFLIIVDVVHIENEKNINSTHKLPRNILHRIVLASWAEILIIRIGIPLPLFRLDDHKLLITWHLVFTENKRKETGRKTGREGERERERDKNC